MFDNCLHTYPNFRFELRENYYLCCMLKHLLVDCSSWVGQARAYVVPFSVLNLILAFPRAFRKQCVFRAYNCEEPLAAVQRRTLIADVEFAGRDHYNRNIIAFECEPARSIKILHEIYIRSRCAKANMLRHLDYSLRLAKRSESLSGNKAFTVLVQQSLRLHECRTKLH